MPYCCSQGAPEAGVLLIDPSTGSCACVSLVPPGSVEAVSLSQWSATDRLLAEVCTWAPGGNHRIASAHVLTGQGWLMSTINMPMTPGPYTEPAQLSSDSLALNGETAVLHLSEDSHFWVWHIDSGEVEQHEVEDDLWIWQVTWSFDSSQLLLLANTAWEPYTESATIWSLSGLQTSSAPAEVQQPLWGRGPHVAMLGIHDQPEYDPEGVQDTVHFFSVTAAGELRPVSVASLENVIVCDSTVALAMSPDGCFVAVCTGSPRYGVNNLAVFSMDGQLLHERALELSPDSLQWSADGAALLVSDTRRGQRVLVKYA